MKKYILSLLAIFTVAFGAKAADITDVLDNAWTGISGTTYAAADNLSASSDAVYSVQCAGGNSAIQLRTNNNNSGIVTTKSGGIAKTIKVTWNGNMISVPFCSVPIVMIHPNISISFIKHVAKLSRPSIS